MMKKLLIILISIAFQHNSYAQDSLNIDSKTKQDVVNKIALIMQEKYVFPEEGEKMAFFINAQFANGEYNSYTDVKSFCKKLTADLRTINNDKHLFVFYSPQEAIDVKARSHVLSREQMEKYNKMVADWDKRQNYGFQKVEILDGNIGYLKIDYFPSINGAETCIGAMAFLANTDAMIIDLMDNGGGESIGSFLSSYFFPPGKTLLGSTTFRDTSLNEENLTYPYVPGKRMEKSDLYILTSSSTFSAAEEFSYSLQQLKRAVVIGETTKGGAHPIDVFIVKGDILAQVSIGASYNPISKTNWEGVGVKPNIEVKSELALKKTHILAIENNIRNTKDEDYKKELRIILDDLRKQYDMN